MNGYPEETNDLRLAKKMLLVQSQAYRKQLRISIYLLPVNLYVREIISTEIFPRDLADTML